MKRLCKWLLGIGGFLALAGALLALQGWLMGGETRVTVDWFGRQLTVEPLGAYAGNRPSGTPDALGPQPATSPSLNASSCGPSSWRARAPAARAAFLAPRANLP